MFLQPEPSEVQGRSDTTNPPLDMGEFEVEFLEEPVSTINRHDVRMRSAERRARRLEAAAHSVEGSGRRNSRLGDWARDIGSLSLIDESHEQELYRRIAVAHELKDDPTAQRVAAAAKHELLEANVRLVVAVAGKRYIPQGLELMDLVAEGNVALVRAIENFDPNYGVKLSTFAATIINRAITDFIRTKHRPVHISEPDMKLLLEHERQAMEARRRGEPEPPVPSEIGLLRKAKDLVSLDKETGSSGDDAGPQTRLIDLQIDPKAQQFAESTLQFDRERLAGFISSLLTEGITKAGSIHQARIRAAITVDAFGLGENGQRYSTKELADKYSLPPERIQRAVQSAQAILRLHEDEVSSFLL